MSDKIIRKSIISGKQYSKTERVIFHYEDEEPVDPTKPLLPPSEDEAKRMALFLWGTDEEKKEHLLKFPKDILKYGSIQEVDEYLETHSKDAKEVERSRKISKVRHVHINENMKLMEDGSYRSFGVSDFVDGIRKLADEIYGNHNVTESSLRQQGNKIKIEQDSELDFAKRMKFELLGLDKGGVKNREYHLWELSNLNTLFFVYHIQKLGCKKAGLKGKGKEELSSMLNAVIDPMVLENNELSGTQVWRELLKYTKDDDVDFFGDEQDNLLVYNNEKGREKTISWGTFKRNYWNIGLRKERLKIN